jgi:hypothetical protein
MAKRTSLRRTRRTAAARTTREASAAALPVSAVAKLATHLDNILATFNAHAALLEMLIANVHVMAVGKPGMAAVRAARETARRLQNIRVTDLLRRPPGRSRAEYDLMLQLAKLEFRDIMSDAIDRLTRQAHGKL